MKNIFSYHFDASTGNLLSRKDNIRNITEEFEYDNLNRLTSAGNLTMQYNKLGNITAKSDVGSFEYDNNKPYAIVGATLAVAQNAQFTEPQNVTYNALQLPVSITQGQDSVRFKYNSNGQRTTMQTDGGENFYFSNKYEIINSKEILYFCGDAYSAPAVMVKVDNNWQMNYIGRDYLGSITHIIDEDGTLQYEYSYDAWGNLRNPETQTNYTVPELFLGRGYTGHEHLSAFGLINMNARLYDPALGRFLNPDPIIQDATNKQNFNRYSYCLNNPLKYTDPSGMAYVWNDVYRRYVDDETGQILSWGELGSWLIISGNFRGDPRTGNIMDVYGTVTGGYFPYVLFGNGAGGFVGGDKSSYDFIQSLKAQGMNVQVRNGVIYWQSVVTGPPTAHDLIVSYLLNIPSPVGSVNVFGFSMSVSNSNIGLTKGWDLNGDRILQKAEADAWWLNGNGIEILVDGKNINLTGFNVNHTTYNPETGIYTYSTVNMFRDLPWETAATYGGSGFKLVDGQWQMQSQLYHYNPHEVHSVSDVLRNIATFLGMPKGISAGFINNVEYNPTDYYIHIVY